MRWMRLVVVAAVCASVPIVTAAQSAPAVSEVPRLLRLLDALTTMPAPNAVVTIRGLSAADREGLRWVIKVSEETRGLSGYSVPSYSPPAYEGPTYSTPAYSSPKYGQPDYSVPAYVAPSYSVPRPAPSYRATNGYEPSTVITANPYLGTPISKYDPRVNKYSPEGASNKYTTGGGRIYGEDGTYLGKANANKYDPESIANPYGQYGSKYSPNSINNPYSQYGSKYSPLSARNPYTTTPPRVIYGDTTGRR